MAGAVAVVSSGVTGLILGLLVATVFHNSTSYVHETRRDVSTPLSHHGADLNQLRQMNDHLCTIGSQKWVMYTCCTDGWQDADCDEPHEQPNDDLVIPVEECQVQCDERDYSQKSRRFSSPDARWCEEMDCRYACYEGCEMDDLDSSDCIKGCVWHMSINHGLGDGMYLDCAKGCMTRFKMDLQNDHLLDIGGVEQGDWKPTRDCVESEQCFEQCDKVDYSLHVAPPNSLAERWCDANDCRHACYEGCEDQCGSFRKCVRDECLWHMTQQNGAGDGKFSDCALGCKFRYGFEVPYDDMLEEGGDNTKKKKKAKSDSKKKSGKKKNGKKNNGKKNKKKKN